MERLLINLVVFPMVFTFFAARRPQILSFASAWRFLAVGSILLALAGIVGKFVGQPFAHTFFVMDRTNDMAMGVILGVGSSYLSVLCFIWAFASRRRGEA